MTEGRGITNQYNPFYLAEWVEFSLWRKLDSKNTEQTSDTIALMPSFPFYQLACNLVKQMEECTITGHRRKEIACGHFHNLCATIITQIQTLCHVACSSVIPS